MAVSDRPSLRQVLQLDQSDEDVYESKLVYPDDAALYGGQLAAQALVAAGRTVAGERVPHSLHLYYLSGGKASLPTTYRVQRERDGRGFSARRVVAVQGERVLATVACSFTVEGTGFDVQPAVAPDVTGDPSSGSVYESERLFGFECRLRADQQQAEWPPRFWARVVEDLPGDRLTQAAAVAYLSDRSSGVGGFDVGTTLVPVSLDHAVWFHRPVDVGDWLVMDLVAHTLAAERGWYTGTVHDRAGRRVASFTQEILARPRPA